LQVLPLNGKSAVLFVPLFLMGGGRADGRVKSNIGRAVFGRASLDIATPFAVGFGIAALPGLMSS